MKRLEMELPWPPSINHYKKSGRMVKTSTGKIYQQRIDTKETKLFYDESMIAISSKRASNGFISFQDSTISLTVTIDLYPPNKRRIDIDNRIKVLVDSLVRSNLILDDYLIDKLIVTRMDVCKGGKAIVTVEECST